MRLFNCTKRNAYLEIPDAITSESSSEGIKRDPQLVVGYVLAPLLLILTVALVVMIADAGDDQISSNDSTTTETIMGCTTDFLMGFCEDVINVVLEKLPIEVPLNKEAICRDLINEIPFLPTIN